MKMIKKTKPAEVFHPVADAALGTIEGYASVFGNRDSDGDIMLEGAFDDVIKSGDMPMMFFGHDWNSVPVGNWTAMKADQHGLKISGQLNLELRSAKDIYSAIKFGSMSGLSVGFSMKEDDYDFDAETLTGTIKRVSRLLEVSIVPMPANGLATIEEVKSERQNALIKERIEGIATLKDLEELLRDAGNFSNSQAKALISAFKRACQRDAGGKTVDLHPVIDRLRSMGY